MNHTEPESLEPPASPGRCHFSSLKDLCEPVEAWMEENLGVVDHEDSYKFLRVSYGGVYVRAFVYGDCVRPYVEWGVGINGRHSKCGQTWCGLNLDNAAPPAVIIAGRLMDMMRREDF